MCQPHQGNANHAACEAGHKSHTLPEAPRQAREAHRTDGGKDEIGPEDDGDLLWGALAIVGQHEG